MSAADPETARRASLSGVSTSMSRPSLARTSARNAAPFSAMRQASVATSRERRTRARSSLRRADLQRVVGARHRGLRQAPRLAHALAEADDAREGVDDAKAAPRRLGEQQAAVVGAEIERAVDAIALAARPGRRLGARRARQLARHGGAVAVLRMRVTWIGDLQGRSDRLGRGAGVRRFSRAAVIGVALQSSNSSAWLRAYRSRPEGRCHQASSG